MGRGQSLVASEPTLQSRIDRARELLTTVRHAAMATVNTDGTPHNTPYFFMISQDLSWLYWGSHPDSLHSRNVARSGRVFVVLFDAMGRGGGLYICGRQGHKLAGDELEKALTVHNQRRVAEGMKPLATAHYEGSAPQRMWGARSNKFWVNVAERGNDGLVIQERRHVIKREELI